MKKAGIALIVCAFMLLSSCGGNETVNAVTTPGKYDAAAVSQEMMSLQIAESSRVTTAVRPSFSHTTTEAAEPDVSSRTEETSSETTKPADTVPDNTQETPAETTEPVITTVPSTTKRVRTSEEELIAYAPETAAATAAETKSTEEPFSESDSETTVPLPPLGTDVIDTQPGPPSAAEGPAAAEPWDTSGDNAQEQTAAPVRSGISTKAVWISYIEISSLLSGKDEAGFTSAFSDMLDKCASAGINTVYVHMRAYGDAFYDSAYYPFSKYISGETGKAPGYDPLTIMTRTAHAKGISFHAWVNPLRLMSDSEMQKISEKYAVGKWYRGSEKGKYLVLYNGLWYLNPAYDDVLRLVNDGIREIVSGYDVDGVHIDDYFYPTTEASFDSEAFAASGYSSLAQFRRDRCSLMVKGIYDTVHSCSDAVFGVSPQGNDINNRDQLFADTKAWVSGGYVDYLAPQIYYGFENSGVPYKDCVDYWLELVKGTGIEIIPGLSLYKIGCEDKWAGAGRNEWLSTDTMIKRQIEYAAEKGCSGVALYSYNYMFTPSCLTQAIKNEMANYMPLLAS